MTKYMIKKTEKIQNLFLDNYRVAEARWAGGGNSFNIKFNGQTNCAADSRKVWSSNGNWSGLDASFRLTFSGRNPLLIADGIMNLQSKLIEEEKNTKVFSAIWIKQGRGFSIKSESGFIAIHGKCSYHAKSAKSALKGLLKKRRISIATKYLEKNIDLDINVCYRDSISAGNCQIGTENWIEKHDLDKEKCYNSKYILGLDDSQPVKMSILQALKRVA